MDVLYVLRYNTAIYEVLNEEPIFEQSTSLRLFSHLYLLSSWREASGDSSRFKNVASFVRTIYFAHGLILRLFSQIVSSRF